MSAAIIGGRRAWMVSMLWAVAVPAPCRVAAVDRCARRLPDSRRAAAALVSARPVDLNDKRGLTGTPVKRLIEAIEWPRLGDLRVLGLYVGGGVEVLVLSHHLDSRYAMRLLEEAPEREGYVLKERVSDIAVLAPTRCARIDEGECVIDPAIVSRLMARKRERGPLKDLTDRKRQVLALVAQGHFNGAIGEQRFLSRKTVESHTSKIFAKLDIGASRARHQRVLAVLAFLRLS
jgi:DNA-binding NarL/FixJ family response regulator